MRSSSACDVCCELKFELLELVSPVGLKMVSLIAERFRKMDRENALQRKSLKRGIIFLRNLLNFY